MKTKTIYLTLLTALLIAGCARRGDEAAAPPPAPLVERVVSGNISVEMSINPPVVNLEQDTILTITTSAPSEMEIRLPVSLQDRLDGFLEAGSFDIPERETNGHTVRERRIRLTPLAAERWRIAPFIVNTVDNSHSPPLDGWLHTPAVRLAIRQPESAAKTISYQPRLLWIAPNAKAMLRMAMRYAIYVMVVFAIIYAAYRLRRAVILWRMSPRERALRELQELMGRDLIGRQQVKQFYLELTMIVRRYIERAHAIRAPEQTTEEFLQAVAGDSRFSAATLARLKDFLEASDLVKFAGSRPAPASIDNASHTAREYIEHDRISDTPLTDEKEVQS